jgi:hypothetical protein
MCLSEAYKKSLSRQPEGHRLRLMLLDLEAKKGWKIDIYPDIFSFPMADRKTYGSPCQRCLQGIKNAIFDLYHDIFSALSVRLDV